MLLSLTRRRILDSGEPVRRQIQSQWQAEMQMARLMRSKLFVPGSRPELFEKAWRSDADALSFDLEDAVVAASKAGARNLVAKVLGNQPSPRSKIVIARVNPVGGADFEADLEAVARPGLDVVNLPKVEAPETVQSVARRLEEWEAQRGLEHRIGLLVNIETPRGLRNAAEIAISCDRVVGLQLGFGDLFSPLGIERSPATLTPIWLAVRLAAAEAGIPAYDGAFVGLADIDGFRVEAQAARAVGFAGKSCVHPSQVPIANAVFFPTDAEIAAARRIVARADEMESSGVGAFVVDGVMFDGPFIASARAVAKLFEEATRNV